MKYNWMRYDTQGFIDEIGPMVKWQDENPGKDYYKFKLESVKLKSFSICKVLVDMNKYNKIIKKEIEDAI